jgi:Ca2+-binding EF-hand superfamily protein
VLTGAQDAKLSREQVQSLQAHFQYADRDRSGTLNRSELEALWRNAFQVVRVPSPVEPRDRDRDRNRDRNRERERADAVAVQECDRRMLQLIFDVFDRDRSGQLSFNEFVIGFGTFNHELNVFRVRLYLLSLSVCL